MLNKAYRLFEKVKLAGLFLSGGTIFFMMLFIVADIVLRNILKSSVFGSYEITEYFLMPLAVFPALAYALSTGVMPRLEIIVQKMNENKQRIILLALLVFECILFILLTYYTFQYALIGTQENLGFSMKGHIYPYYPILYFVPLGLLLFVIEILFMIARVIKSRSTKVFN